MAWQFKHEESQFVEIPEGKHRVVITSAEMAVSKTSGNDMLVIKMAVSGYSSQLWNYIVFLDDKPEITNRMLTQFFDSFGIEEGNFNLSSYVGHAGAAQVKHDEQGRAKVAYFIPKAKQGELPPWKGEIPKPKQQFEEVDDGENPFDFT